MDGTQASPTDTPGTQDNKPVETNDKPKKNDKEPLSLYDKTEAIVTRQEKANEKTEELLKRQETLHANQRLAGTGGGHIKDPEKKEESPKEYNDRIEKEISEGKHND